MTNITEFQTEVQWIFKQHDDTNHMYDTYLPYSFHLRMVSNVAKDYIHLLIFSLSKTILIFTL